jgi:superfamily I DNA/RNA helicase
LGSQWENSVKGVGEQALKCIQSELETAGHVQDKIQQAVVFLEGLTGSVSERVMKIEASDLFKLPPLDAGSPFYQYAQLFGDNAENFAEFLKLSNDQSALGAEKVHVITAHAAKGLEFRCVFMAGLMRGVFPLSGSSPEEEQNLFYVGMTRAKDLLYLVCPQDFPSEFVGRIPAENSQETKVKHKKPKPGQMVLFD